MSRRHATYQVDGEEPVRKLAFIECDGCDARIEPSPDIMNSGWTKQGMYWRPGDSRNVESEFCPRCS